MCQNLDLDFSSFIIFFHSFYLPIFIVLFHFLITTLLFSFFYRPLVFVLFFTHVLSLFLTLMIFTSTYL
jgi:hypothetical protein